MNLLEWILDSLEHHAEEWTKDDYAVRHRASGVEVWCANGLTACNIYRPEQLDTPFLWKLKAWKLIRNRVSKLPQPKCTVKP